MAKKRTKDIVCAGVTPHMDGGIVGRTHVEQRYLDIADRMLKDDREVLLPDNSVSIGLVLQLYEESARPVR